MAADILLSGRVFTAQEAFEMGLVNRVSEDALAASLAMAEEICQAAPQAVETTLMTLRKLQEANGLGFEVDENISLDCNNTCSFSISGSNEV